MPASTRRVALALAASALAAASIRRGSAAGWPRQVKDMLGRVVTIPARPRAILLGEGFQLLNLALLHPDPASLLVGMGGDLRRLDPVSDAAFRRRFPALEKVPEITAQVGQGFPAERALALKPDLAILSSWQAGSEETRQAVALLEGTGVPVVYVDVFRNPGENTLPTIRLLGALLGQEDRAEAYARFYEERRDRLVRRVAESGRPGPRVLLTAFPGRWPCCWAAGGEGGSGEFLTLLGARNLAAGLTAAPQGGNLAVEQVLVSRPEVFVGTGIHVPGDPTGIQLGAGASPEMARASLEAVLRAPELAALPAVRDRRAHGLWNPFNGALINIVALEALARWIRPELFGDVDPGATLAEINARFAAIPYEGTYWTSLQG
ncbi:ABC transporter substrate-binding protein [Roseomonas sp. SSH11]|uniref:ABC transporter substrate-binding protein n=2 Tax=Pararoseomonas baculiformis TaxID=2820812 RepID=A0ABS4A8Q5_9PROT|nr:ABC transporter substrate-binding protein [Pararoseomonas baculiformis]